MLTPKRMVIPSDLTRTALLDVVRRGGLQLRPEALPSAMRAAGARAVRFVPDQAHGFRVELDGVRSAPGSGIRIAGRGRITEHALAPPSEIEIELGADPTTKLRALLGTGIILAFGVYRWTRSGDLTDPLAATVLFAPLFYLIGWLETARVTARVWPGLVELVRGLAEGRLGTAALDSSASRT